MTAPVDVAFSVVIPVFNHARFVERAAASALASRAVSEVLLIDDGSSDASREAVRRIVATSGGRARDLTPGAPANCGTATRLNELIAAARSEWIAVLNSDDVFVPGRFELVAARLAGEPAAFVFGQLLLIDGDGRGCGSKRGLEDPEYAFPDWPVAALAARGDWLPLMANQNVVATTSNMLFTRTLHRRIGGFRQYRYVHDWDFALRAAATGECAYVPQFLTQYRFHDTNTIHAPRRDVVDEVRAVFRDFERDHPEPCRRPDVRSGLDGNRYLAVA